MPPTAALNVVVPLSVIFKFCPPFNVLTKLIFAPLKLLSAPNVTAPLYVCRPVVVIFAAPINVAPETVKLFTLAIELFAELVTLPRTASPWTDKL